ncbi:serine hydrolase domain-containing protein [Protaetiibacter mangrovi]|uniref:Beta-lactamase family protein n=1 Tax=Protaetiibacter mangrovi TaxID=2970926 RepID=A0ABT1ZI58_9MICO|nr:serine hydrolase [Protaetiibacter mangrovi]MCS0500382.1 beta-lactamase family protein [Protaetiibacter mangrovi]TPX05119.1 serine hydrolase [Schumannella luteola]
MRLLRGAGIVAASLVLVLVVALTGAYLWQGPILLTGTGYAAHNACAVERVAGREDPATDLPDNPLVPYLQLRTDGDVTTASVLGVGTPQQARFTEGFGCTLASAPLDLGTPSEVGSDGNPFTDAATPASTPELEAALDRAFGSELSADDAAALGTRGVVIAKDGVLVAERYADGFDASTPQLGWSMSKSVTSLMTGMLAQQGVVALDDDRLRPEWTDERADITVENLLRMDSGIRWDETYDLGTPITRMLYLEPDMGGYVASLPLAHAPGEVQQYSSGSTTLLCSVLAERTGLGADLPRQTIFSALGLSSAVMEPDAVGTPVCSSYMWATPRDWAAVGQFALQGGMWNGEQLLPADWMRQSLTVTDLGETDDPGFGMGWRVNELPDGSLRWPELPRDTFYASGHDGQKVIAVPSHGLVVVRMGFTPAYDDAPSEVALVEEAIAALG